MSTARRLYAREVGEGRPVIVVHGGPDFDHYFLRPELDALADSVRLVYYDQRGRGRSAPCVRPADVGIDSEIEDLDQLRASLGLDSVALLGHSWVAWWRWSMPSATRTGCRTWCSWTPRRRATPTG